MENAAICVYDEGYLLKNPTNTDYCDLAELIAH
jgi:aminopeptidase N